MFKKLFASVGIGSAKVDTRLENDRLTPGDTFRAEVVVTGGNVEQEISGLELALLTQMEVESGDEEYHQNHVLQRWSVAEKFTIGPEQERVIPIQATLHPETPITEVNCPVNKTRVWIKTGLEIDAGLDAGDKDYLRVLPSPAMAAFLQAMESCDLVLYQADVEKGYLNGPNFRSSTGCYQELEFKPRRSGIFGMNEVEVSFVPTPNVTHVMLEIDRSFSHDRIITLDIDHGALDIPGLAQRIRQAIG